MKSLLSILILLGVVHAAPAQVSNLVGNYQFSPALSVRRTLTSPDTTVYLRCADDRSRLPLQGTFRFFWADSMEILQYAGPIIALGDTYTVSSEAETRFAMQTAPLGTGWQLAMLKDNCFKSFFFQMDKDTLRTSMVARGQLPISFGDRATNPCDTLGLMVLLPWLACALQDGNRTTFQLWVDDPDADAAQTARRRRAAKRLAALHALLRQGLGDAYQYVRVYGPQPGHARADRFRVQYALR